MVPGEPSASTPFLTIESSRDPFLSVLPSTCPDASSPLLGFFSFLDSTSEDERFSPSFEETVASFFQVDDFSFGGAMTFWTSSVSSLTKVNPGREEN